MSDWFNVDSSELFATNPYYWAGTNKIHGTTYYHCNDDNKAVLNGVKVSLPSDLTYFAKSNTLV